MVMCGVTAGTLCACSCPYSITDLPFGELGLLSSERPYIREPVPVVFSGKVIAIAKDSSGAGSYDPDRIRFRFKVSKAFRDGVGDTVDIYTFYGECAFYAPLHTNVILFAYRPSGETELHTLSCLPNVSQQYDLIRYSRVLDFLEALTLEKDGAFVSSRMVSDPTVELRDRVYIKDVVFSVSKGQLHGHWQLSSKEGDVLEEGFYDHGKKVGTWITRSGGLNDDYETYDTEVRVVIYEEGLAGRTYLTKQKQRHNFGDEEYIPPTVDVEIKGIRPIEKD